MTKFRKVRCPKGRSTALFACQKCLLGNFFAFLTIFGHFLAKKYPKIRFYRYFWKKIHPKLFFDKIDKNKPNKCRFDENPKSQMPVGTLNRTFCLSKINLSYIFLFFCIFGQKFSFFSFFLNQNRLK